MLALAGVGTLCPTMSGMAPVLFSSHFGLLGGFISSLCLAVSMTMALGAYLPEPSQAPLGRVYLAIGTILPLPCAVLLVPADDKSCAPHPLVEAMPSDSACFGDAFRPCCLQPRPDRFVGNYLCKSSGQKKRPRAQRIKTSNQRLRPRVVCVETTKFTQKSLCSSRIRPTILSCQVESWCQAALHPKTCCKHLFDSL
jgi:hypothetical protein